MVMFFNDETTMTSLKWRHNWFFKVRFCHNLVKNHTTSGHLKRRLRDAGGEEHPAPGLGNFWKFISKIMHFRHISVKTQPKNLKLVYYQFLAVRGNIRLGETPQGPPWLLPWAESGYLYRYVPFFPNSRSLLFGNGLLFLPKPLPNTVTVGANRLD